ncbi:hypothetical protein ABGB19_10615 [Mycobacterium sp. B14F4]|uniref:hypothetical protein n=1 Tax=Mycobacterium sp. B14F4 TaxID=3153565 RepID=UPI00325F1C40
MVFFVGLVTMILGVVGGMFPLWKSATLSPASIQRRVYWSSCIAGIALMFISQIPQWRSAVLIAGAMSAGVIVIAFGNTSHIKIRGKVYAAYRTLRKPDPPPALEGN